MKYCGVELKGNDAIVVAIESTASGYSFIAPSIKKFKLNDSDVQVDVQSFTSELKAFFDEYKFDKIVIKARGKKGKFAGGPSSFKIEGIIQNMDYPVELLHIATVKSRLKDKEPDLSKVTAYQSDALRVAVASLS